MIDLRSDTVTQPTDPMRHAMATATVGDDVLGDDPTVNALEARTAELLGKAAAVYMPSGTMTNQTAIRCHTQPGDEIYIADNAHVYFYEGGAPGGISGVLCRMVPSRRGVFTGEDLQNVLRPRNYHHAPGSLVCLENTSNRGSGKCWPAEAVQSVARVAREHELKLHLDGARLWNASVATGTPLVELAEPFDSVSVCFSKGLGAPVGSALVGSEAFVDRARRFRKMLGGAMRQAGIIAAGALYALEHHRDRLNDDHANARALAEGLAGLEGISLDPAEVETNIVIFRLTDMPAAEFVQRLAGAGVGMLATAADQVRAVTNLMVAAEQIPAAVEAVRTCLNG